jgi:phage repressor protein C with HTH and peptisase S24 domain
MFTHTQIWDAFDAIAQRQGLSPSGLAKCAGYNATSFNRSKRFSPSGRERWPSTDILARVLRVASMDLRAFADLIDSLPASDAGERVTRSHEAEAGDAQTPQRPRAFRRASVRKRSGERRQALWTKKSTRAGA